MATPLVLTDCRIFAGAADLTSNSNKVEINAEVEEKDVTNFASGGYKECRGGIASSKIVGAGQWEAGDASKVDDEHWADLGNAIPYSVFPSSAAEASLGYFVQAMRRNYVLLDAVGEVAPWSSEVSSTWPVVRGLSLENPGTPRTATGNGTAVQLGAVPAGKRLYAALHVLSISGSATPTLTVKVQSDTVGFPSPTDQITFTAATAIGGQIARTAVGAITDDYYRVSFTISGTTPSFLFLVVAGIAV